jgi:hypothetical protein
MRAFTLALALLGLALPATASAGAVNLRFAYGDGAGHRKHATLTCDGYGRRATGYLRKRDAARLCATAYRLKRFLGSAAPQDRVCTELYGGPDRARVRGNVAEAQVDRRFDRTDGCGIADWDKAQPLLPRPLGARGG